MAIKLYELSDSLRMIGMRLAESIGADDDGEIPDDLADELDSLQESFEAKADGVCGVRSELLAEAEGYNAEIIRLTKLRDATMRRAEWLKSYLKRCMDTAGVTKLKTRLHRICVVRNSQPTVKLADGADIPSEFEREVRYVELDKAAVVEQWKAARAALAAYERELALIDELTRTGAGSDAMSEHVIAAEASRVQAMELDLPTSLSVTVGTHLRIA